MTSGYDAFVSYNHSKDRLVAARLQKSIQRLGKPWYLRRAARIFRDDTSLSATPHLWPTIVESLKASRFMILIASPEAAASRWVYRETEFWLANKGAETLLIALTAGELTWDSDANDFLWLDTTPLPQSLRGHFENEPKWIDLRPFRASPSGSTQELSAAADLAATIRGIPKEDLLSEEVRQHRRAMFLSVAAIACLFLLSVAAGLAWRQAEIQRRLAILQRDRAENTLQTTVASANDLVLTLGVKLRQTLGVPVVVVNDFLRRVESLQDNLTRYNATSVELERAQAVTLRAQSQVLLAEGDSAGALKYAEKSSQIVNRLLRANGNDQTLQTELSFSLDREGEALSALGRYDDSLNRFHNAQTIRQVLIAAAPSDARRRDLALTDERMGDAYFNIQKYAQASDMYNAALKLRESLHKTKPDDADLMEDLAVGYDRIARMDQQSGDADPVERLKASIAIRESLTAKDASNSNWLQNLATDYDTFGLILINRDDCPNAIDQLKSSLKIRERLIDRGEDIPTWQGDIAATLFYLAECNDQVADRLQRVITIIDKIEREGKLSAELIDLRSKATGRLHDIRQ
jgi:tetratricopeptide (TPR) repeat protein